MPKLIFEHRLCELAQDVEKLSTDELNDTILLMIERCEGVLHALSLQFETENFPKISDRLNACVIQSALCELQDIKWIIEIFQNQIEIKDGAK